MLLLCINRILNVLFCFVQLGLNGKACSKTEFNLKIASDSFHKNYRIRPNYRPCPHNHPLPTFYFIFTYYRQLDDLFPDFLL